MQQQDDFFSAYNWYTKTTEVPRLFHRWSAIAGVGALLGRNFHYPFGSIGNIYPNIYCMLIGEPGTKKSTAIKLIAKLLLASGYIHIGPNETSKEKFLMDLEEGIDYYARGDGIDPLETDADRVLQQNLFGDDGKQKDVSECLVAADEFNNFIGYNNINFISTLGELWDHDGPYKKKLKNSKSVYILNPTLTILGGNTATNYALAFPPQILGQGFFSRLLHIHAEETGIKIHDPEKPTEEDTKEILKLMNVIRRTVRGEAKKSVEANLLLKKIYEEWPGIDDERFRTYANRRYTHLIKACLIHAAARYSSVVEEYDVIYANTVLTYTEHIMPKALGEFGKSKHSDVSNKIMNILDAALDAGTPVTLRDIWRKVSNDLEKYSDLGHLVQSLVIAEKIQQIQGGFLPKRKARAEIDSNTVCYELLTEEERKII